MAKIAIDRRAAWRLLRRQGNHLEERSGTALAARWARSGSAEGWRGRHTRHGSSQRLPGAHADRDGFGVRRPQAMVTRRWSPRGRRV